jgi:protein-tyrosine phosphatase
MHKITDRIWIGSSQDARNADALRAEGITSILNCAVDLPPALGWRDGFKHYHVGLVDGPGNGRLLYHAAASILFHLMDSEKTLVHCHEGRSRSVFVVAMTLAQKLHEGHLSMIPKMVEFVRSMRPTAEVHPSHLELFDSYWNTRNAEIN